MDHRLDVNKQSNYGESPFHKSCRHPEICKLLLQDARVNPNIKNKYSRKTPLHNACESLNQGDVLVFLKQLIASDRFIDIYSLDQEDNTPKQIAQEARDQDVVRLIENYENNQKETVVLDIRTELGLSPLKKQQKFIYACADGRLNDLKKLLYSNRKITL